MVGLPDGKKSDDIITRFDTTHERDTHTQTDRQTPHDCIGRAYTQHRAAGKGEEVMDDESGNDDKDGLTSG